MVHFSNFFLLGKLSCVAFGDFFEVASEVIMECFFNLERDQSITSYPRDWGELSQ